ncbi:MAG: hypothetical protein ACYSTZ_08050 [Planctomycetota bacterium]|jgi:hypothetical protein
MMRWISIVTLSIVSMLAGGALSGCSGASERPEQMPDKTIEQVLNERTAEWMAIPGVEGTAIGIFEGRPCIRVFTSSKLRQVQAKIPSTVEGYPVIIEQTGTFRALEQD